MRLPLPARLLPPLLALMLLVPGPAARAVTCDDFETTGLWWLGHITGRTCCSTTAQYLDQVLYAHSGQWTIDLDVVDCSGSPNADDAIARNVISWSWQEAPDSLDVWYQSHNFVSGNMAAIYGLVKVAALNGAGVVLDEQTYCVAIDDTDGNLNGDYEHRADWIYQERRPAVYQPGAPDYERDTIHHDITPPIGWWYKLTIRPGIDLSVTWASVASIRVELRSGGVYMFPGNRVNHLWDDFCAHEDPPPDVAPDSLSVSACGPVDIAVLDNDSDPEAEPLSVASIVTTGTHGQVLINPGQQTVHYVPAANFSGWDHFGYRVSDGAGPTVPGDVWVYVRPALAEDVWLDPLEGGPWGFGHEHPGTSCGWRAGFTRQQSSLPVSAVETWLGPGSADANDWDAVAAWRWLTRDDFLDDVSVWFQVGSMAFGGGSSSLTRERASVRLQAYDAGNVLLGEQNYCVVVFDNQGDWEHEPGWIFQESRPAVYESGAPPYGREADGSIRPPVGWWYRLDMHPEADLAIPWYQVRSVRIDFRVAGAWMHGDDFRVYWDDLQVSDLGNRTCQVFSPAAPQTLTCDTTCDIVWWAHRPWQPDMTVDLDWSFNNGLTWQSIAAGEPSDGLFTWIVPRPATTQALVRVTARTTDCQTLIGVSPAPFTIVDPVGGVEVGPDGPALFLGPAVPNPSDGTTRWVVVVPAGGRGVARIFDFGGRLVRTLTPEPLDSGGHLLVWDGRDASERQVASGLYFCRLETEQGQRLQRVMLIRPGR